MSRVVTSRKAWTCQGCWKPQDKGSRKHVRRAGWWTELPTGADGALRRVHVDGEFEFCDACEAAGVGVGGARVVTEQTVVIHVNEMREGDIYIGRRNNRRGLPESEFANPFPINRNRTREEAIAAYREWLLGNTALMALIPTLRGKRLACWCSPEACHGDVLAELAEAS
jgi:hypothetical protein